ncbi:hypothetical protein B0H11DRAFT_1147677 [Mycena galericulata]|nr:hypothetical protein B0H11DRAFT_1147677 [Mycena galericulata]
MLLRVLLSAIINCCNVTRSLGRVHTLAVSPGPTTREHKEVIRPRDLFFYKTPVTIFPQHHKPSPGPLRPPYRVASRIRIEKMLADRT